MRHAREDYNGRVVDLLEPRIIAILLAARLALTHAADAATVAGESPEIVEAFHGAEAGLAELYCDSTCNPIPDDEPVFLLRAQDVSAAQAVRFWATRNATRGGDASLSQDAEVHAARMEGWPIHKLADR
jgi:hypothetical protein